jgi:hypothetical protein
VPERLRLLHPGEEPEAAGPADLPHLTQEDEVLDEFGVPAATEVVEELTAALEVQRRTLAPETVMILERTLRVIDDAIAEARAALAADPRNGALVDVLSANYEQKVHLLRRASELRART